MTQFAADMAGPVAPYTVLQKDSAAHIVHLTSEDVRGYVCFEPVPVVAHGPVTKVTGPALLWSKEVGNYLRISYANPRLDLDFRSSGPAGVVTTEVRLDGGWTVDDGDPRASVIPQADGSTVVRYATRHGLPVEIGLLRATRFTDWQQDHFSPVELLDPAVSGAAATPAGDGVANVFKYSWNLDPWMRVDLAAHFHVGFFSGRIVAGYRCDRARPDAGLAMEQSTDLRTWTPLAATLHDDRFGIETWQATLPVREDVGFVRLAAAIITGP